MAMCVLAGKRIIIGVAKLLDKSRQNVVDINFVHRL